MPGRDERAALNEAKARAENEQGGAWFDTHARVLFRCECCRDDCDAQISLSKEEYERVRAMPTQFAVKPGHVDEAIEYPAERWENFWVTEKATARGKEVAEEAESS